MFSQHWQQYGRLYRYLTCTSSCRRCISLGLTLCRSHNNNTDQVYDHQTQILDAILTASTSPDVDTRVIALRSLTHIYQSLTATVCLGNNVQDRILEALSRGLNDYTINERGDVGSLARIEALLGMQVVWTSHIASNSIHMNACDLAVKRLALERLDKVRLQAARCLMCLDPRNTPR